MSLEQIMLSAFITIFACGLFIISLASYRRYKNMKLFFIAGVFLVFLLKGVLLSLTLFNRTVSSFLSSYWSGVFDVIILLLLFMATLKR